jgi:uncharacterized membrane protein
MTNEQTPQPATNDDVVVVAAQLSDDQGVLAEGAIAAQGNNAIVLARFADTTTARRTYDALREGEAAGELQIDGVLVVNADDSGQVHVQKLTDHSTRTGLKWGIVGGIVAGVFLPATIVAGAVALGVAGAAAGKARNLKHRVDIEKALKETITAGTSGIIALVTATAADEVAKAMPEAQEVKTVPVDDETADAVKAAAAAAGDTPAEQAAPSA